MIQEMLDLIDFNYQKYIVEKSTDDPPIYHNGYIYWSNNNTIYHRENDLPAVITFKRKYNASSIKWCHDGLLYRENGPSAFLENEAKYCLEWYQRGFPHRNDGPFRIVVAKHTNEIHVRWACGARIIDDPYFDDQMKEFNFDYFNLTDDDKLVISMMLQGRKNG